MKWFAGLASFLFVFAACDVGFIKGWLVDQPRVLGARVEAQSVSWLVARATRTQWAYAVCADTKLNAPRCDTAVLAAGAGVADGEVVTMPRPVVTTDALMLAAFCMDAEAALEPAGFTATCVGGGAPLLASVRIGVAPNAQPEPPALVVPADCVAPGSKHELAFTLRAEDREPGETLLASTTVTDGELERQYTALEPNEPAPRDVRVPWSAPATPTTVGVYLVLRDGRGGTSFTTAQVCVR